MIVLVLLLAFILRLVGSGQSLWLDESVQAVASLGTFSGIFTELVGDFHPPFYHIFLWTWVHLFGSTELILRLPSIIFGVVTVYSAYLIAKTLQFKKPLIAGLLMASAPYHIYYSQEARAYSLSAFLATLSMYWFIKMINKLTNSKINTSSSFRCLISNIQYPISLLLLIYTDYYGFFIVLAQFIVLLFLRRYKCLLLNSVFLILSYLPWLPGLIHQIKAGSLATQTLPGWGSLVNLSAVKAIPLTFLKFTIGRITIFDRQLYIVIAFLLLFFIGILFFNAILSVFKMFRVKNKSGSLPNIQYPISSILLWFLVPLISAWVISFFIPNFQPFRLLLILPAFYLILFIGISSLPSKIGKIVIGLLFIINTASVFTYFTNPYFQREDWRGLCYLSKTINTPVLLVSDTLIWPLQYYGCSPTTVGKGITEVTVADLSSVPPNGQDYLYSAYLEDLYDPGRSIVQYLTLNGYNKISEYHLNQIPVVHYAITKY